ncbi:MAG TPA: hypothetical protein ENK19_03220, partial [Acidobacteria bacterium]|nr:hypothetical protein [Acidobacteriota bacterium]
MPPSAGCSPRRRRGEARRLVGCRRQRHGARPRWPVPPDPPEGEILRDRSGRGVRGRPGVAGGGAGARHPGPRPIVPGNGSTARAGSSRGPRWVLPVRPTWRREPGRSDAGERPVPECSGRVWPPFPLENRRRPRGPPPQETGSVAVSHPERVLVAIGKDTDQRL